MSLTTQIPLRRVDSCLELERGRSNQTLNGVAARLKMGFSQHLNCLTGHAARAPASRAQLRHALTRGRGAPVLGGRL